MKRRVLLVGGGGYCKQVIEILRENNEYDEIGIVENENSTETSLLGLEIVGHDCDLEELHSDGWNEAIVTLGSVGNTVGRRRIYENLSNIGFKIPVLVSKAANVANTAILQEGCIIHPGAIIDAAVEVGKCSIINKGSILSHDCKIGNFVHVSPGCILLGNVQIGDDSHIGAASALKEGTTIGKETMIGMGSIVVKDIPEGKVAFGNPCIVRRDK